MVKTKNKTFCHKPKKIHQKEAATKNAFLYYQKSKKHNLKKIISLRKNCRKKRLLLSAKKSKIRKAKRHSIQPQKMHYIIRFLSAKIRFFYRGKLLLSLIFSCKKSTILHIALSYNMLIYVKKHIFLKSIVYKYIHSLPNSRSFFFISFLSKPQKTAPETRCLGSRKSI